jgi:hypothetical protein
MAGLRGTPGCRESRAVSGGLRSAEAEPVAAQQLGHAVHVELHAVARGQGDSGRRIGRALRRDQAGEFREVGLEAPGEITSRGRKGCFPALQKAWTVPRGFMTI